MFWMCRRAVADDARDADRFEPTLVLVHPKRELYEVAWRRGKTYGVKFLTMLSGVVTADPMEASVRLS